jgi:hypothetical protein
VVQPGMSILLEINEFSDEVLVIAKTTDVVDISF